MLRGYPNNQLWLGAGDMTRIEVVTYDVGTGHQEVDHTWDINPGDDETKLLAEAHAWADFAAESDKSTDHVVYVRGV